MPVKHWIMRWQDDRSVDPSTHRIILKIVGFLVWMPILKFQSWKDSKSSSPRRILLSKNKIHDGKSFLKLFNLQQVEKFEHFHCRIFSWKKRFNLVETPGYFLGLVSTFLTKQERHTVPWPRANNEFLKISWKNNRNILILTKVYNSK